MSEIHPSGIVAVWVALGLYATSRGATLFNRWETARWVWLLGALAFLSHTLVAMGSAYGWSLATALDATARDTEAVTGIRSGQGLWLNYLFTLIWITDAVWWTVRGTQRYRTRARWLELALQGFLLFMIANGAVVFVAGPGRYVGIVVCTIGLMALLSQRKPGTQKDVDT